MSKLLQLTDDLAVIPRQIAAIKRGSRSSQSVVFLKGMSSQDGFVVDVEFEDLLDIVDEANADAEKEHLNAAAAAAAAVPPEDHHG